MLVIVFPPKLSYNNLVILDSLYGIGNLYFYFLFDAKFYITLPNVVNDKLIFFNSKKCALFKLSYLLIFSDPARSHKFIFDFYNFPFLSILLVSIFN